MPDSVKNALIEFATSIKVGYLSVIWGISLAFIKDYINPVLLVLTPALSFMLLIMLIRLQYRNSEKSGLELRKLRKELNEATKDDIS